MYTLHCTKKLLDRVKVPLVASSSQLTTGLGNWYAAVLFWKPQLALLVNERTLLPVSKPLAPSATLVSRFPHELAAVLRAHGASQSLRLAHTLCGALKYNSPGRLLKELVGANAQWN